MIDNKKHLTNSKAAKNKRAGQLNRYSTSKLNNRNSNMTNKVSKVNDKVLAKDSKAMKNCMQSIYENILKPYVTQSKVNKDSTVICLYEVSRGGKVYPDLLQLLGPVVDETKIKYLIEIIEDDSKFPRCGEIRKVGTSKSTRTLKKSIPANAKSLFDNLDKPKTGLLKAPKRNDK